MTSFFAEIESYDYTGSEKIRPRMLVVSTVEDTAPLRSVQLNESDKRRHDLVDFWVDRGNEVIRLPNDAAALHSRLAEGINHQEHKSKANHRSLGLDDSANVADFIQNHSDIVIYLPRKEVQ